MLLVISRQLGCYFTVEGELELSLLIFSFCQKSQEAGSRHDIKEASRGVAGDFKVGSLGSHYFTFKTNTVLYHKIVLFVD